VLGTGIGYLLTGSPDEKKKDLSHPPGTTQETVIATKTTTTDGTTGIDTQS